DAERLRLDDVPPHLRVSLEVFVDEPLCLFALHVHPPGEPEVTHPVDDPEVEHLRDVALLFRHSGLGNAEAGRSGATMHVRSRAERLDQRDRKSTRLNSSHLVISYAVFCLKKKRSKKE